MSRIGKKAVPIPAGVTVTLDGQTVTVKGPKGQLSWTVVDEIEVSAGRRRTHASRRATTASAPARMWGLSRTLVANMVARRHQGLRADARAGRRRLPRGDEGPGALACSSASRTTSTFRRRPASPSRCPGRPRSRSAGIDKQLVGETAARIRKIRPPEPYKGKGVRYAGEKVRRKEGKKK